MSIKSKNIINKIVLLTSLCILSACGGGSGSDSNKISLTPNSATQTNETPSSNLPTFEQSPVTVANKQSALPETWRQGPMMEIYVRGYQDSDGDGIGDLRGLIQRLDYLHDLGIKGIWLMPITESDDQDHGYAVKNYRNIEPKYGSLEDFDRLVQEAHVRGIGIILDYVMNHSARTHPAFINAADTSSNAYRQWYIWKDTPPTGWNIFGNNPWYSSKNGNYFAAFYSGMPDFNLLNPQVIAFHENNLRFWLNRGVDGFRFDAVGNLIENNAGAWESQPESIALMGKIRENVQQYDNRFIVCEAPGKPLAYAASTSCGNAFAFQHNYDLVRAAQGQIPAIQSIGSYFNTAPTDMATMISNHDEFAGRRLWDQVNGDIKQYQLAAATYLLQPGTPFIYYGEEIGMSGAANLSGDQQLRTPMSWNNQTNYAGFSTAQPFRSLSANRNTNNVADQIQNDNSLYQFYKKLIALRLQRPSLSQGNYTNSAVDGSVLSFHRSAGNEKSLIILNYGSSPANISLSNLPANRELVSLYPDTQFSFQTNSLGFSSIQIPAQMGFVFDIK
ncbi:alpha-amylase family glycosyl hydrolase [Undibacterium fentianense]|uniref:Alpha-amylase n=1 Tax=Undibacterium fentianense TaxID=2828728 RepID=A0A941IGH7_9BURK|nr:alpha-amylase family glycosyl hydrolase [Undibacterium fentianense]MBR7800010.1 alpha-amylase [Undibacterium fentianense]